MVKRLWVISVLMLVAYSLSGCNSDSRLQCSSFNAVAGEGHSHADGGERRGQCSPAQVAPGLSSASAIHAQLAGALRDGDGIAVNYQKDYDMPVSDGLITIVVRPSNQDGLIVVAGDHWLRQSEADQMVAAAGKDSGGDRLNQTLALIGLIHQYQDTHPRPFASVPAKPAASTVSAAPATVTVTPKPDTPKAPPPPYNWTPVIVAWVVVLFGVIVYPVLSLIAWRSAYTYSLRQHHNCCYSTKLCDDHQFGAVLTGIFWPFVLPVLFANSWAKRTSDNIMNRDHSPRQQRRLLTEQNRAKEEQNRAKELAIKDRDSKTAYMQAEKVLRDAGVRLPDLEVSDIGAFKVVKGG